VVDSDGDKTSVDISLSAEALRILRSEANTDACVVVLEGARVGSHVVLTDRVLEIGRSERCGLQLDVPSVSRVHASIEWDGKNHVLRDNGSTNGTYVHDARTNHYVLRDGDRFEVGHVLLKYLAQGNIEGAFHAELQKLATHDALTGLINKANFTDQMRDVIAKTRTRPKVVTLLMLDLDHFKQVNDTYGHPAGDAVLRKMAELLKEQAKSSQLCGRVGGEEFAVLCPGDELKRGSELGERIRFAVEKAFITFDGQHIPITTSVGVASRASESDESAEKLFERADAQLYAAKAAGRNRVC
jgi:diguanylate cyclase (GGDEF)-like protein